MSVNAILRQLTKIFEFISYKTHCRSRTLKCLQLSGTSHCSVYSRIAARDGQRTAALPA